MTGKHSLASTAAGDKLEPLRMSCGSLSWDGIAGGVYSGSGGCGIWLAANLVREIFKCGAGRSRVQPDNCWLNRTDV